MQLRLPWTRDKAAPPVEEKGWSGFSFGRSSSPRQDPNWFQMGVNPPVQAEAMTHAAVAACITILSQEVARLRIEHYKTEKDKSRTILSTSIAAVLRRPNQYQTRSDFFLNLMRDLLLSGNAYAIAERSAAGVITAMHPRNSNEVQPWVVPETGEIFYSITKIDLDKASFLDHAESMIPARNMLHIKLDTPGHPLIGVTPLTGCQYAVPQGIAIQRDSTSFFSRMSRPSGVLKSPNKIGGASALRLKKMWEDGLSDNFAGKTAILDNGLEWQQLTLTAADSQLIEQYNMTIHDIAMVYRVPLYMLGDLTKATFNNVEALQKAFQAGSLGFYTEHIEAALDVFFDLNTKQYLEFDMERGIVKTEFETRMTALTKGVQGGLMTINEGRAYENRPPVIGGDQTFLQRQNWPIDKLGDDADPAAGAVPAPAAATPKKDDDKDKTISPTEVMREFKIIQGGLT